MSWTIYSTKKKAILLPTCLKMMTPIIVVMKCNKYSGICKYFDNFLEIPNVDSLNRVKLIQNPGVRYIACPLRQV